MTASLWAKLAGHTCEALWRASPAQDSILLHDASTGQAARALHPPPGWHATALAFSPDGATLAVAGWGTAAGGSPPLLLFDCGSGEQLWGGPSALTDGAADGASNRDGVPPAARCVAFSPDGRTILTGAASGLNLWDARTGAHRASLGGSQATDVCFTDDSLRALSAHGGDEHTWVKSVKARQCPQRFVSCPMPSGAADCLHA